MIPTNHPPVLAEEWRPIRGYTGFYEVSNMGRVRSVNRRVRRRGAWAQLRGRILRTTDYSGFGHQQLTLSRGNRQRVCRVHVLVLRTFVGPPPKGMQTRHLDGDATNNHLHNLRWGTPAQNAADRSSHGNVIGDTHPAAKLSSADVVRIRRRRGEPAPQIAKDFGVTKHAIHDVLSGRTWRHVL